MQRCIGNFKHEDTKGTKNEEEKIFLRTKTKIEFSVVLRVLGGKVFAVDLIVAFLFVFFVSWW